MLWDAASRRPGKPGARPPREQPPGDRARPAPRAACAASHRGQRAVRDTGLTSHLAPTLCRRREPHWGASVQGCWRIVATESPPRGGRRRHRAASHRGSEGRPCPGTTAVRLGRRARMGPALDGPVAEGVVSGRRARGARAGGRHRGVVFPPVSEPAARWTHRAPEAQPRPSRPPHRCRWVPRAAGVTHARPRPGRSPGLPSLRQATRWRRSCPPSCPSWW